MPPKIIKQKRIAKKPTPKKSSFLDNIRPVQDVEQKDKVNIYGLSGTGKTTVAASYPKPLLVLGAEDGTRSIKNLKGVDFYKIAKVDELSRVVQHVRESKHYKSLVLDTATSMQALILSEILGLDDIIIQNAWGRASRQQYGDCALQTKEILRSLLRLAEDNICHTIILAQEKVTDIETDDDLIKPSVMSYLSDSVVSWLNAECDYIMHTFKMKEVVESKKKIGKKTKVVRKETGNTNYGIRIGPHPYYLTKFRKPLEEELPDYLVLTPQDNPYEMIHEIIDNS